MKATNKSENLNQYLSDCSEKRQQRYEQQLITDWPTITDFKEIIFLGAFSWTLPMSSVRMLYKPTTVDIGHGQQTPGEIVRDYLDWKFPSRLRATRAQRDQILKPRSFPHAARIGMYPSMSYVDLKSAYWTITQAVGWSVDYYPGRWVGQGQDVSDFPLAHNKLARSAMVTAGLSTKIQTWTGFEFKWKSGDNLHINYGLWAIVQDVLHGVARQIADELHPVYIHTDGYIVPTREVPRAAEIIQSWGLNWGIKATGDCRVSGIGSYSIGAVKTSRNISLPVPSFNVTRLPYQDWLRERLLFFSRSRGIAP